MKKATIRFQELTLPEAREELKKTLRQLFDLRMDKMTGKLKDLRSIYHKRKEIAKIKTIIHQKE